MEVATPTPNTEIVPPANGQFTNTIGLSEAKSDLKVATWEQEQYWPQPLRHELERRRRAKKGNKGPLYTALQSNLTDGVRPIANQIFSGDSPGIFIHR
jgi:hypothetical protein